MKTLKKTAAFQAAEVYKRSLKDKQKADQTANNIKNKAIELGVRAKDLMELLRAYYLSDAGSYTSDAGGKDSLDKLFIFNRQPNSPKGEIKFAPEQQAKYAELLQHVYQT